jgi:hypothetical protein
MNSPGGLFNKKLLAISTSSSSVTSPISVNKYDELVLKITNRFLIYNNTGESGPNQKKILHGVPTREGQDNPFELATQITTRNENDSLFKFRMKSIRAREREPRNSSGGLFERIFSGTIYLVPTMITGYRVVILGPGGVGKSALIVLFHLKNKL